MKKSRKKVPYLDLSITSTQLTDELLEAVRTVLTHGRVILGPEVSMFEEKISDLCFKSYAVGVGSGTDALYLALRAADVSRGDEVITTPLSWIATANAITLVGACPVYVDIGTDLNIDPMLIEEKITPRTKAIVPVHFTGAVCRMDLVQEIAFRHGLLVIEDAAQAFGSKLFGRPAGSFGQLGCFSMNPMKILNAWGEAGVVVTDDRDIYDKLRSLRYGGTVDKEDCHFPSINGRIDTIQAAMLLVSLKYVQNKIDRRREIAERYNSELSHLVQTPNPPKDNYHTYYSYTIITPHRDELKNHLEANGIETKIQHPILMPFHTAYKKEPVVSLPVAERLVKNILCLPNHEALADFDQSYIVEAIKEFFDDQR